MKHSSFSEYEQDKIRQYYLTTPTDSFYLKQFSKELGYSSSRICEFASSLGLTKKNRPHVVKYKAERSPLWVGDNVKTVDLGRQRARKIYKANGICAECLNAPAVDIHHKDSNPLNNSPDNITFLCRRCHMDADGRLEVLRKFSPTVKPPKNCILCNKLEKNLRKGRCHSCNEYFRRHGVDKVIGEYYKGVKFTKAA